VAESCRKLILAGKVVIALATLTAPATVAGLIQADQLVTLAAIAVGGSNARTRREATANMRAAEARRAELIAALPFSQVIEEGKR
jgi:electron transfer flavoprotein alpha/beta subunit